MFVEAFADARHVGDDGNAEGLQQRRRSDARQLQKLRRIIGAGRQDQFARGARRPRLPAHAILDAGGAASLEQNARGQRVGDDAQIGAAGHRFQVGLRGRAARALARRRLVKAGAFLRRAVEVVVARIAALDGGFDEGECQRMLVALVRHGERAVAAVQFIGPALVCFRLAEVGKNVVVAPAGIAELAPHVEVLRLAADVDHAVDRARSAEHLAARRDHRAPGQFRLRFGFVTPVVAAVGEQLAVAERDMNPEIAVRRPRLQQEDAVTPGRRQPVGQHAAGATGADDDEIVCFVFLHSGSTRESPAGWRINGRKSIGHHGDGRRRSDTAAIPPRLARPAPCGRSPAPDIPATARPTPRTCRRR